MTGSLVAACCGLLGCFLILRRMAMVGDAISHAVLPGIVIAFLVSGSRESVPMLLGAGLLGLFTTFLIEFLHKRARVQADASIGVTFTSLFALGVILVTLYAGSVDLDLDCVLYGEIAYVPLDLWITQSGLHLGPRTVWILAVVTLLVLLFVWFGYKELFLTTFDPAFASAVGFSTGLWYYLLMGAVSLTTVATFESVGAILVVAFLVAPPATAYLLTDNLKVMLVLAVVLGIVAATGGYFLAVWIDGSIAGAIATVTGLEFAVAFLWSPLHGIFRRKTVVGMQEL